MLDTVTPTAATHISLEEFYGTYGSESGWEYWHGVPRRKPVPTRLHGLLAALLGELLRLAGYIASVETDCQLSPDWSPRPDACGELRKVEGDYPTHVDVVMEVLSKGEDIEEKCREYSRVAVGQIFVFNAEARQIWEWIDGALVPTVDVLLASGVTITGKRIWSDLESRCLPQPPVSRVI